MANTINTKKTSLFVNIGNTLPVAPAGAIETNDPVLIVPEFTTIDINRITGKMNSKDSVVDTCLTKTSFDAVHTLRTSNAAADALATPPSYGLLLQAAGFNEIIDSTTAGEETVTYTNNNDSIPAVSAVAYLDDYKFEMTGSLACGTELSFPVGAAATIKNSFQGYLDNAVPVSETNPVVTLSNEQALVTSCADLITYDGVVIPVEQATIKTNSDIQELYTTGGTSGIKTTFVSDYALDVTLDFYVDKANFGREANAIENGLVKELVIKLGLDSTSSEVNGKSVVITCPMSKVSTYSDSTDKDTLKRSATYRIFDDGATPAISIKNGFFA
jgi:hypothetical protein